LFVCSVRDPSGLTLKQWEKKAKACKKDKVCLKKLGKKPAAPKPAAAAKAAKFLQVLLDADQEAEIGALVESESEAQVQDELQVDGVTPDLE